MNLFMQFTGISSWYSMNRLQQAMRSGIISRASERQTSNSANQQIAVNGQRNSSEAGRASYAHPFLGKHFDIII